jgi:hypothetical protein
MKTRIKKLLARWRRLELYAISERGKVRRGTGTWRYWDARANTCCQIIGDLTELSS